MTQVDVEELGMAGAIVGAAVWAFRKFSPTIVRRMEKVAEAHERALADVFERNKLLTAECAELRDGLAECAVERARLRDALTRCRTDLEAAEARIGDLEAEVATLRAAE